MALETLRRQNEILGEKISRKRIFQRDIPSDSYISVDDSENVVAFKLQDGPIKEYGKNGCQIDHIIATALTILKGLNDQFSCRENAIAITKLQEALMWMEQRKRNRIERGVEGEDKK